MLLLKSIESFELMDKYREIGFKLTPQRIAILDYLTGNKDHPSAEDIFRAVSIKFPTMSLATVYNTLDALVKKNDISELKIDTNKKRFDPDMSDHNHLICIKCCKIVDVFSNYTLEINESQKYGFDVIGNQIEFYGICPECKERLANDLK